MIKWNRQQPQVLTYTHDTAEVAAIIRPNILGIGYVWEVDQWGRMLGHGETVTLANARANANQWIATAVEAVTGEAL